MNNKTKSLIGKALLIVAITWITENVLVLILSQVFPNIKDPGLIHGLFFIVLFVFVSYLALLAVYGYKNRAVDPRLPLILVAIYFFLGLFDTIVNWYLFDIILRLFIYPILAYIVVYYFLHRRGR